MGRERKNLFRRKPSGVNGGHKINIKVKEDSTELGRKRVQVFPLFFLLPFIFLLYFHGPGRGWIAFQRHVKYQAGRSTLPGSQRALSPVLFLSPPFFLTYRTLRDPATFKQESDNGSGSRMPAMHVALNFNTYYKKGDRNKIWNRHIKPLFTSMHTEYKREREIALKGLERGRRPYDPEDQSRTKSRHFFPKVTGRRTFYYETRFNRTSKDQRCKGRA